MVKSSLFRPKWWTSEVSGTGNSQFVQINKDMVFASLSNGMGADRCEKLCETLNLSALHHKSFQHHAPALYNMNADVRKIIFSKSAEIVRKEPLKCPADDIMLVMTGL